jgi:glutamate racemase
VAGAAARTPADCGAVVLGCTEYELAADLIGAALPGVTLFRSAAAVAAQALRRVAAGGTDAGSEAAPSRPGTVRVLLSGRQAGLPEAALRYAEGRLLADLVVDDRPFDDVRADDRPADDRDDEPRAGREAERSVPPSSVLA